MRPIAPRFAADDAVPLLLRALRGGSRVPWLDARVVEGGVHALEHLNAPDHGRLHVAGPRHVAPDGHRPPASLLDRAGRLSVALLADVGNHHAHSCAGERQGRRPANAARGPGDRGHLARETSAHFRCHCHPRRSLTLLPAQSSGLPFIPSTSGAASPRPSTRGHLPATPLVPRQLPCGDEASPRPSTRGCQHALTGQAGPCGR